MRGFLGGLTAAMWLGMMATPTMASPDQTSIQQPAPLEQDIGALADRMQDAIDKGDWARAEAAVASIVGHSRFQEMPGHIQGDIYFLASALAFDRGDYADSVASSRKAVRLPGADESDWDLLIRAEWLTEQYALAADALIEALPDFPNLLDRLGDETLSVLLQDATLDSARAFRVRAALLQAGWDTVYIDTVRTDHVEDLMEAGRLDEAIVLARMIEAGSANIRLRGEKRYDRLMAAVNADPPALDEVFTAELIERENRAQAADADLNDASAYANTLFMLGRSDMALSYVDAVLALPAPEANAKDADIRPWLMDTRARLLLELGFHDEAITQQQAAIEAAAALPNGDRDSFVINLGYMHLRLGRPDRALAAVVNLTRDDVSPYGMMQLTQVRTCASWVAGDADESDRGLALMQEMWRDAPDALVSALACRGEIDDLARLWVNRLEDPELRADAVLNFHDYRVAPGLTPFDLELRRVERESRDRTEVRNAFDVVGRVLQVPTLGFQF